MSRRPNIGTDAYLWGPQRPPRRPRAGALVQERGPIIDKYEPRPVEQGKGFGKWGRFKDEGPEAGGPGGPPGAAPPDDMSWYAWLETRRNSLLL